VEHIGQSVIEVSERIRRANEERYAALPDCAEHPGYKQRDCVECQQVRAELRQREVEMHLAEQRAEAVYGAEQSFGTFPPRFRSAVADHGQVVAWGEQFADETATPPGLLLLGPTGVGKTWQAYGALKSACVHPIRSRFGYRPRQWKAAPFADLMASLRPRSRYDTEEVMEELKAVDLLLVDDLAAAKGSEWVEEQTYRLINSRYEAMLPTIFTTNLAIGELRDAIGDRVASRLAESCTRIVLAGADRRRARSSP
jgi:DNA replication protein DnaC